MAARVQEHVGERVPDLARRAEDASVKPFREHRAVVAECPVQRTCDPFSDRHHPTAERARVARFDDEMRVRVLQRVVDQAEVAARADGREALLEPAHERDGP